MKTVGIIAEYNPFHTGHEYHLKKAREASGADYVIVVISPDFVQRGEPAIIDKYTRTRMALLCGADLVLELPVCYATGSAEYFAEGAVSLFDRLGVVDTLCFGAENDDIRLFHLTARILSSEPREYQTALQDNLKKGMTFPQARSAALSDYLLSPNAADSRDPDFAALSFELRQFLETPNNILGIEYCKALQKSMSRILPLPIMRTGSDYNSRILHGPYCSASAIRENMKENTASQKILSYIPDICQRLFEDSCHSQITTEDLFPFLQLRLMDAGSSRQLSDILDISSDLADRIWKLRFPCLKKGYEESVSLLKTRQMTETRIRRALLHLILDIRSDETEAFRRNGISFYAHVLGFRKNASPLLHSIKEESSVPLLTRAANASQVIPEAALHMWEKDLYASHLYRSIQSSRYALPFRTEYETSPVII